MIQQPYLPLLKATRKCHCKLLHHEFQGKKLTPCYFSSSCFSFQRLRSVVVEIGVPLGSLGTTVRGNWGYRSVPLLETSPVLSSDAFHFSQRNMRIRVNVGKIGKVGTYGYLDAIELICQ